MKPGIPQLASVLQCSKKKKCCTNLLTLNNQVSIFIVFVVIANLIFSSEGIVFAQTRTNDNQKNLGEDGMVIRTKLELTCLTCSAGRRNNTCTEQFRKNVTRSGIDYRCRIYERNGMVVAQGMVPSMLCTTEAKSRISGRTTDRLLGEGRIFVGCCNSDSCNTRYCEAIGMDDSVCNTTIGWKKPKPLTTTISGILASTSILYNIGEKNSIAESNKNREELTSLNKGGIEFMQNDDPNRQVESYLGKLNGGKEKNEQKFAPLKTNETDASAKAEPITEPEPEGNDGNAVNYLTNTLYKFVSFGMIMLYKDIMLSDK